MVHWDLGWVFFSVTPAANPPRPRGAQSVFVLLVDRDFFAPARCGRSAVEKSRRRTWATEPPRAIQPSHGR